MLICRKLNQQERLPIHSEPIVTDALGLAAYRLPTDAEWEWVARGGRSGCGTMNVESLRAEGWILANSNAQMAPRGQKDPNPFGVYDMIGNAQEWCLDEFDELHFQGNSDANPMVNPLMDAGDSYHRFHHILRGGSVIFKEDFSNYSYRTFRDQHSTSWFTGFRIVLPISGVRQQGHEPKPTSD
jgi:formylglycine-generating enzyme required for sulfatase activity